MNDVTVITAALPERADMLAECKASVQAQTVPARHLVMIDRLPGNGCAWILNALLERVETEWVMPLADDDWLYPQAIEQLLAHDGDVIYGLADLSDWPEGSPQRRIINQPGDFASLSLGNFIPGGGAILYRTELVRQAGGWDENPDQVHVNDWVLLVALYGLGARFVRVPEVLWHYRMHSGQLQAQVDGRW